MLHWIHFPNPFTSQAFISHQEKFLSVFNFPAPASSSVTLTQSLIEVLTKLTNITSADALHYEV